MLLTVSRGLKLMSRMRSLVDRCYKARQTNSNQILRVAIRERSRKAQLR